MAKLPFNFTKKVSHAMKMQY